MSVTRSSKLTTMAAFVVCLLCGLAQGATIFVKADAAGANNGASWADAFTQVQPALNAAVSGDEVWVAAGTYVGCITLSAGVALYGGFVGSESTLAQRNWEANKTVLEGNQLVSVVTSPSGATSTTRIDGFTITKGSLGGIYCSSSSPTISNNTITENVRSGSGGGICCANSSSPTISNNTISGNTALDGGGVFCSGGSPTIADNTISRNRAEFNGGGIACGSSSPTITNNTISDNTAFYGGGIDCRYSSPTIAGNTISSNNAGYGGGVYCYGGTPAIRNNVIAGNSAGIYCALSSATILNNSILGNSGAGLCCSSSSATIGNTIIAFNSSGISKTDSGTPILRYNCVYGNTAYNYSGVADPTGTNGNISVDPKLAGFAYGNLHIQPDSPCRDAGDDSMVQPGWLDLDSQPRLQGSHVDIGADESDGTAWTDEPSVIVRVSPKGDDANDGSSWVLSKRTVQAAIDAAASRGGEVWIQAGTYYERVTLAPFVHVYGGFGGTESTRALRDWVSNVTILDAQQDGTVVTATEGHRVSTIDGCTIRYGKTTVNGSGAGVHCSSSSPMISNNTIAGNNWVGVACESASPIIANNTITSNSSGGISCVSSSPVIVNDTIMRNSGGGISCTGSSPTIANTIIAFNSSGILKASSGALAMRCNCVYGNAAYNYSGVTDPTGTDGNISVDPKPASIAYGNTHIQPDSPCRDAGDDTVVQAGWLDMDGQARVQDSHVDIGADESNGTAWSEGPYVIVRVDPGGDDTNDGSSWSQAKRTVQAGVDVAARGGEVWVKAGTYLKRITLPPYVYLYGGFGGTEDARDQRNWAGNPTVLDGQQGGPVVRAWGGQQVSRIDGFTICNGGGASGNGISCSDSSPTIANNKITRNRGGGISCSDSSPMITNNTITGNGSFGSAGGIYCSYSSPTIANNTIVGNSANGIYCSYSSPAIVNTIIAFNSSGIYNPSGTLTLRCNCVHGNAAYNYSFVPDPTGTNGNISTDPRLAGAAYGNVHIQPDSPCRDGGDDAVVQAGWADIDGQARVIGSRVDIGADESDGTVSRAGPYVVVRVSLGGDDGNDGSSWTAAKRTVQAGIDTAAFLGGEVWVEAGVYPERITLHSFAYLYGGFAGTEIVKDERAWAANVSILDGQQSGSAVTAAAGYRVSTIDGFTIRNGTGTLSESDRFGGGIYCLSSSPTIAHNTIVENSANDGGGIYCSKSSPIITSNMISENSSTSSSSSSSARGGGISCASSSSPLIANNTITGNGTNSSSTAYGGGICCSSSSPIITSNAITGNRATGTGVYGAGISCSDSSPTIDNNTIAGNIATAAQTQGAGIHCYKGSAMITGNTITGNTSSGARLYGGGIYCAGVSLMVGNTIIAFNPSGVYAVGSGGLSLRYNCVFGNTAYNYSGVTDPTGTNGNISVDPLFVRPAAPGPDDQWGTPDDDYGNLHLQPGSPCIDAGDNAAVSADMLDLDGDGNVAEPVPFDLGGGLRFFDVPFVADAGLGAPPIVDMGAYEFVVETSPDLDGDGDIDAEDFDRFLMAFGHSAGQTGYNMTADLDMDGVVTFVDYQQWLQAYRAGMGSPQAPAPLWVLGDFGVDGHVDGLDLEHFERCATGAGVPQTGEECRDADLDRDGDVDQSDFGSLQRCFSGSGMVDLGCKY